MVLCRNHSGKHPGRALTDFSKLITEQFCTFDLDYIAQQKPMPQSYLPAGKADRDPENRQQHGGLRSKNDRMQMAAAIHRRLGKA